MSKRLIFITRLRLMNATIFNHHETGQDGMRRRNLVGVDVRHGHATQVCLPHRRAQPSFDALSAEKDLSADAGVAGWQDAAQKFRYQWKAQAVAVFHCADQSAPPVSLRKVGPQRSPTAQP